MQIPETDGNELETVISPSDRGEDAPSPKQGVDHPVLFAPTPLSTRPSSRLAVPIRDFDSVTGIDFTRPPSRTLDFADVEVDLWGRQLFAAVDDLLSSRNREAIECLDGRRGTKCLADLLERRGELADAFADWLEVVLDGEPGAIAEAREFFAGQLRVRLSNAYTINTLVRYGTRVDAKEQGAYFISAEPGDPRESESGMTGVPVLLRSCPASPLLVDQTGERSESASSESLEEILLWDYSFEYSRPVHYPQDQLYFRIDCNVPGVSEDATRSSGAGDPSGPDLSGDLFAELAQFVAVYPAIESAFRASLTTFDGKVATQSDVDAAGVALESFNRLLTRIVSALRESRADEGSGASPERGAGSYRFMLREGSGRVGTEAEALVITLTGRPPEGMNDPIVEIPGYTTHAYEGTCAGDFCFRFEDEEGRPLPASVGRGIVPRKVTIPQLNILRWQSATATVSLNRNADLVSGRVTAPAFVYTTDETDFADPCRPLVRYDEELRMSPTDGVEGTPRPLKEDLQNFFALLFVGNGESALGLKCRCEYSWRPSPELPPVRLPVMMQPIELIDVAQPPTGTGEMTLQEMIDHWSSALLGWLNMHRPTGEEGRLCFDLEIFPAPAVEPMPLVHLSSLVLDLTERSGDIPVPARS